MRKLIVTLCGLGVLMTGAQGLRAEAPPDNLVPAEVEKQDAEKEVIGGAFPGLLLTPRGAQDDRDGKYSQPYHAACCVYLAQTYGGGKISGYARRFVVHVPEADALPLAKRVARMLLLLLGENRERLHVDHPRDVPTVDVWLTRQNGQRGRRGNLDR